MSIFWGVIALFYLVLAIVTYFTGKPLLKALGEAAQKSDGAKVSILGVEIIPLLNKAFKTIFITDVVGFVVAAIAAAVPAVLGAGCP